MPLCGCHSPRVPHIPFIRYRVWTFKSAFSNTHLKEEAEIKETPCYKNVYGMSWVKMEFLAAVAATITKTKQATQQQLAAS